MRQHALPASMLPVDVMSSISRTYETPDWLVRPSEGYAVLAAGGASCSTPTPNERRHVQGYESGNPTALLSFSNDILEEAEALSKTSKGSPRGGSELEAVNQPDTLDGD